MYYPIENKKGGDPDFLIGKFGQIIKCKLLFLKLRLIEQVFSLPLKQKQRVFVAKNKL